MTGKRVIRSIRARNFLSFGAEAEETELQPLNVLIGPNGSGKSNFLEIFRLLGATPTDLARQIRFGGGVDEWLWKGTNSQTFVAEIEAAIEYPVGLMPLRYRLSFTAQLQKLRVAEEIIQNCGPETGEGGAATFFEQRNGSAMISARTQTESSAGLNEGREQRLLSSKDLAADQSILSQRKDPDQYPEISYLANLFSGIAIYPGLDLGPNSAMKLPQKADMPEDILLEDASNLGLVLNHLEIVGKKAGLLKRLRTAYPAIENVTGRISGGTVQIYFLEKDLRRPIPAPRASDGMLRYLSLLAVFCHPDPPPVLCIEEPEIGLHPDIIPEIAELLIETSKKSQIILTTHSDILVSALTNLAGAILVCERDNSGSRLRRLDPESLKEWLADFTLGQLWHSGELGGTQW